MLNDWFFGDICIGGNGRSENADLAFEVRALRELRGALDLGRPSPSGLDELEKRVAALETLCKGR